MITNKSNQSLMAIVAEINDIRAYIESGSQDEETAKLLSYLAEIEAYIEKPRSEKCDNISFDYDSAIVIWKNEPLKKYGL